MPNEEKLTPQEYFKGRAAITLAHYTCGDISTEQALAQLNDAAIITFKVVVDSLVSEGALKWSVEEPEEN